MNNQRRGRRTRRPSDSESNTQENGTPETTDTSGSDDAGDGTFERGTQESTTKKTQTSDSSTDKLARGNASGSENTDDDAAAWAKLNTDLANEKKRRQDAQRKITEQGNENKGLAETNADLQRQVDTLKMQMSSLLAGDDSGRSTDLFGGGDAETETGNSELEQKVQMLEAIVGKNIGTVNDITQRFDTFQDEQVYEADVTALQDKFGVGREAAQTMIEAFDQGNVVAFAQAFELASIPREARETLREERARRRSAASVGHPGVPNPGYSPTNTDADSGRQAEADRIMKISGRKARQTAIYEALDKDPGMFDYLKDRLADATGFNL